MNQQPVTLRNTVKNLIPPPVWDWAKGVRTSVKCRYFGMLRPIRTCRVGNQEIRISVTSDMEDYRAKTYASKEPETLQWLSTHLKPGDVFYDIGANIGLYSLYAAKISPESTVYGFEPESQNYASFCHNIYLNGLANVVPLNTALSDEDCVTALVLNQFKAGAALHSIKSVSQETKGQFSQGVLSITLNRLVKEFGLPKPSLIKLDVDGAENRVLLGASDLLKDPTLRSVLVELSGTETQVEKIASDFCEHGFDISLRSKRTRVVNGVFDQNFIFVRK